MSIRSLPRERGAFERTRDHWWWREGWRPGTRYLTWHLTFEGATRLREVAERASAALGEVAGVDVVPVEWLHLTMTGVGFADDIDPSTLANHAEAGLAAASGISATPLVFDRLFLSQEGICLSATSSGLQELKTRQNALVQAIGGPTPERGEVFYPHVTLAYFSHEISEEALNEALDRADIGTIAVPAPRLSLIELGRDERVYTWRVVAQRALGD